MSKKSFRRIPKPLKLKEAKRLDAIGELMDEQEWDEAQRALLAFTRRHPDIIEGWSTLMELADACKDLHLAYKANRHLLELEPSEEAHHYNAAVIAAQLGMPFSALHYVELYLDKFPQGAQSKQARQMHAVFAPECERLRHEDDMAKHVADVADLRLFEEAQMLVSSGDFAEGRKLSLLAAQRLPHAPAPLNNVSLAYAIEGRLDEALKTTQQVLAQYPDNIHARCNLAQYLVRLGRSAEAKPTLDSLRAETPSNLDHWVKLIETFAYAGDDEAVIEIYQRAQHEAQKRKLDLAPIAEHFAAASYARLGQDKEARRLWTAALKRQRNLSIAQDNLADLRMPVGSRNGAWHFSFNHWVNEEWIKRLTVVIDRNMHRSEQTLQREVERVFQAIPPLRNALIISLHRGDPIGREMVLHFLPYLPVEELRQFALGQHGTDATRMEIAQYLVQRGELNTSEVPLYVKGTRTESLLMNYEIYSEPVESTLPPEAQAHLETASDLLYDRKAREALEEIEAGLRIVPEERTFLNQKAVALAMLNRTAETNHLIRHMAALYPDYLFARCAMAQLCAREKKFDEAHDWLEPLMKRSRFHISEFRALAMAHMTVHRLRGDKEAAKSWEQMLRQMDEEM